MMTKRGYDLFTSIVALVSMTAVPLHVIAQPTLFITYQGRLNVEGTNYTGVAEFQPSVWNGPTTKLDSTLVAVNAPTNLIASVEGGLFVLTLSFGDAPFQEGFERWLQLAVRTDLVNGEFTTLSPRQLITPTPYAITAHHLSGNVSTSQLPSEVSLFGPTIESAEISDGTITSADIANGTITPADVNTSSFSSEFWLLGGNVGSTPGTHFLGTIDNQPLEIRVSNLRVLRFEENGDGADLDLTPDGAPNVIGGSPANFVAPNIIGATVSGGGATNWSGSPHPNSIASDYATVGGGMDNMVPTNAPYATIGGGLFNRITAVMGTVAGGRGNQVLGAVSTIGGGNANEINGGYSAIGGGEGNLNNGYYSTIGGGYMNSISNLAWAATICGGLDNTVQDEAEDIFIGGGYNNQIGVRAHGATIAGGFRNTIASNTYYSTITGGEENTIKHDTRGSAIVGGYLNMIEVGADWATIGGGSGNTVLSDASYVTIAGGDSNTVQEAADWVTISGGRYNLVEYNADRASIGGGQYNTVKSNSWYASIGGGSHNTIGEEGDFATIGGGFLNTIHQNNSRATVGGGSLNTIQPEAYDAMIGGGFTNSIGPFARGSFIAGGWFNTIGADSEWASIGGGLQNEVHSNAPYAIVPGGRLNSATNSAFAAGTRAKAIHTGSFVWADSTAEDFASSANDQFNVRANGGARIVGSGGFNNPQLSLRKTNGDHARLRMGVDSDPTWDIAVNGGATPQMKFYHAGLNRMVIDAAGNVSATAFNPTSDRAAKENFETIDPVQILQKVLTLPLTEWNYKADPGARHVGPVAQDFHAAFGLGTDDKHIATVDADGVALAAIQGMNQKLTEELNRRDTEKAVLEARLKALEQLVADLLAKGD